MKAMVLERITDLKENPEPLSLTELPDPEPSGKQILVKVSRCGVCHTELDEIEGRTPPPELPVVPGHQVVGRVERNGPDGDKARQDSRRKGVGDMIRYVGLKIFKTLLALACVLTPALNVAAAEGQDEKLYTGSEDIALEMELSEKECFVGQAFVLDVSWLSRNAWNSFRDANLILPILHDSRFKIMEPSASFPLDSEEAVGLPVSETRVLAMPGKRTEGGVEWNELRFRKIIIPGSAGRIEIDAAELKCALLDSKSNGQSSWNRYPSYFDNNFFDEDVPAGASYIHTFSSPQTLKVKPLPPGGSSSNVVAVTRSLNIAVTASPKMVAAGDPIELKIELSGETYPEGISAPDLGCQLAGVQFELDKFLATPEYDQNKVIYKRVVRPKSHTVVEIPPIAANYFDPESKAYKVARSKSIPLEVSAAREIGIEDAQGPGAVEAEKPSYQYWAILAGLAVLATAAVFVFGRRS